MIDLSEMLAELRVQFAAKLPARVAAIAQAVVAASSDEGQVVTLRHLVHQLRGSSGSYGLTMASEQLARIETMIDNRAGWDVIATAVQAIAR